jgi:TonB family protein
MWKVCLRKKKPFPIESTAPKYLSYLAQVKAGVRNHWIFPPQAREKRATGRLTAVFTIDKTGKLLRIVVEESSGFPILDHAAMEAVRGASPFPPFPDHITLERLNIRAMFDYRIKYINVQ